MNWYTFNSGIYNVSYGFLLKASGMLAGVFSGYDPTG